MLILIPPLFVLAVNTMMIDVDSPVALREHLKQNPPLKGSKLCLCLPRDAYAEQSISVPEYYDSTDIEQYIHLEQATYFPHIAESIYFDFEVKEKGKVCVYAIAISIIADFLSVLAEFGISAQRVIIRPADVMINFLPWREWQRQAHQKKCRLSVVAGIAVGILLVGAIYSVLHQDIHRLSLEQARLQRVAAPYQALLDQQTQAKQLEKVQAEQYHWLCLLKEVEVLRPPDLVLSNITLKNNVLMIEGQAKSMRLINTYENTLHGACAVAVVNLLSIEKGADNTFPWIFKVSLAG